MSPKKIVLASLFAATFGAGFVAGNLNNAQQAWPTAQAAANGRVFELRTYTTFDGKLPDLLNRFRDHTTKYFERHGMTNVGYWVPEDAPLSQNTLVYMLAYPSREAAKKAWDDFRKDPDWLKARDASEANGKIVEKVVSVFVEPTAFSPIK